MLFTYKYISDNYITNDVEKFQKYLDFLFKEVWLKAEGKGKFDISKLDGFPELKQIYIDLGNIDYDPKDETKNKKGKFAFFFNSSIVKIYDEFANLDDADKKLLSKLYDNNNNIEGLCTDKNLKPISYKELKAKHSNLEKVLKSFYDKLYGSSSPFNLKLFGFLNNEILPKHYKEFMKKNTEGICPFCGIHTIKENNHSYREAYDHYIPKGIYPFVSLNFKNLAPMCQECNSTYKGTKLPIEDDNKKRKLAFYPYAKEHPKLKFEVKLKSKDILNLKTNQIDINVSIESNVNEKNTLKKSWGYYLKIPFTKLIEYFKSNHEQGSLPTINKQGDIFNEEIDSWKRVFGIEERYKALVCNKNVGISWFQRIYDEFENASKLSEIKDAKKLYDYELRAAKKLPLSDYGFIKSGFLEECKKIGLLNAHT